MAMIVPITFSELLSFRINFLKPYAFVEPFLSPCHVTVINARSRVTTESSRSAIPCVEALKLTSFHPLYEVNETRTSALGQSAIKE